MLTFNSGKTIRRALESVQTCAEILIIDGGSTDDTLAIAQEFGAQIIPQGVPGPLSDFSMARNKALNYATHDWILVLDSDEYISSELMIEIEQVVQRNEPAAYLVPRKYVLENGTVIEQASTYPNTRLYFFHRKMAIQWIKPVHERIDLKDGTVIKQLECASLAPLGTIEDYKRKNIRYLEIEYEKSKGKGWLHWFIHKLLRAILSRTIALGRILNIWLIPRPGKRLPLSHEVVRFWYAIKLVITTMPRNRS